MASVAALAIRVWAPESLHMALFLLLHSLSAGVVLLALLRSSGKIKIGSTLHNGGDQSAVKGLCGVFSGAPVHARFI